MNDQNDARYQDILRRIEQKRREEAAAPVQADLAEILDGLNAASFLKDTRKKHLKAVSSYGPKTFRAYAPVSWIGAVIWVKPRGYLHYQTLTLFGVWAVNTTVGVQVIIGTKLLHFKAAIFNAESYYHHLKRRFDIYYEGDANPPPEADWLYQRVYENSARLKMRAEIQAVMTEWSAQVSTDMHTPDE